MTPGAPNNEQWLADEIAKAEALDHRDLHAPSQQSKAPGYEYTAIPRAYFIAVAIGLLALAGLGWAG